MWSPSGAIPADSAMPKNDSTRRRAPRWASGAPIGIPNSWIGQIIKSRGKIDHDDVDISVDWLDDNVDISVDNVDLLMLT